MASKLSGDNFQPCTIDQANLGALAGLVFAEPLIQSLVHLPQIPSVQAAAKDAFSSWVTTVRPTVFQANTDLLSLALKIQTFFPYLVEWAADFSDSSKLENFTKGVELFLEAIDSAVANVKKSIDVVGAWELLLSKNAATFSAELTKVQEHFAGNKEELSKLQNTLGEIRLKLAGALSAIARQVATGPFGGILIPIGKLVDIGANVIPIAGIVVAGGSLSTGVAIKDFAKTLEQKADTVKKVAALSPDIALAQSISSHFTALSMVGSALKGEVHALLTSWQDLQSAFRSTRDALASASGADGLYFQGELKSSQTGWRQVVESTKRAQSQLANIPVKVDLARAYSRSATTHAARRATPLVPNLIETIFRARLAGNETAGDAIRALVEVISNFQGDVQYFTSAVDVYNLKDKALKLVDEVNALVPKLESLGVTLPDKLEALIQKSPLDIPGIKALFQETLETLSPITSATDTLVTHAGSLYEQSSDAVADSQAEVDDLTSEISGDQSKIDALNEEIRQLQGQIRLEEEIKAAVCSGWMVIFCPITDIIADLITNYYGKLGELQNAYNEIGGVQNELSDAIARRDVVQKFNQSAQDLTNHTNKLTSILQILKTHFKSITDAADDEIVEIWAKEQAQDLINALRSLGSLSRSAAPRALGVLMRPSQAFQDIVNTQLGNFVRFKARRNNLPGGSTLDTLSAINALNLTIYGAAQTILQQPTLTLNSIPLFSHQFQLANNHAAQFQNDYSNDILSVFAQISTLGDLVVSLLQKASSLASSGKFEPAAQAILRIQNQIERTREALQGQVNDFYSFFGVGYKNSSRLRVLGSTLTSQPEVAELRKQIESAATQIAANNRTTAKDVSASVLEGPDFPSISLPPVSISVGSHSVLVPGVLFATTAKGKLGGDDVGTQAQQQSDLLRTNISNLASLNADLAVFYAVTTQANSLVKSSSEVVDQLENLVEATEGELLRLKNLVVQLQNQTSEDLPKTLQHWQEIQSGAQKFLKFASGLSL